MKSFISFIPTLTPALEVGGAPARDTSDVSRSPSLRTGSTITTASSVPRPLPSPHRGEGTEEVILESFLTRAVVSSAARMSPLAFNGPAPPQFVHGMTSTLLYRSLLQMQSSANQRICAATNPPGTGTQLVPSLLNKLPLPTQRRSHANTSASNGIHTSPAPLIAGDRLDIDLPTPSGDGSTGIDFCGGG